METQVCKDALLGRIIGIQFTLSRMSDVFSATNRRPSLTAFLVY